MLPIVRPQTVAAHIQKLAHELTRGQGRVTPAGLLIGTMIDNAELAAEVLEVSGVICDEEARNISLLMVSGVYQALKAQAESDALEELLPLKK